ncbi:MULTISPECIES: hypothetical protein [Niastella]|uniref:Uncharacterized protein n=1 Tax=Niastella soli TaxID=2821487 RepID=A0ABS3YYT4_9BACT|nr:hypothetical protein [Niastella soli]MBO9203089.1 hypothetical protein [Niastella soli]
MNRQFKKYKELLEEKHQLEVLLQNKKEVVKADTIKLKLELKPIYEIAGHLNKFTARDKTSLILSLSSDLIADIIFKKIILARAGWLSKLILPYLLKNYSSNFLKEQKNKFFDRLRGILKNTNGKPKDD